MYSAFEEAYGSLIEKEGPFTGQANYHGCECAEDVKEMVEHVNGYGDFEKDYVISNFLNYYEEEIGHWYNTSPEFATEYVEQASSCNTVQALHTNAVAFIEEHKGRYYQGEPDDVIKELFEALDNMQEVADLFNEHWQY